MTTTTRNHREQGKVRHGALVLATTIGLTAITGTADAASTGITRAEFVAEIADDVRQYVQVDAHLNLLDAFSDDDHLGNEEDFNLLAHLEILDGYGDGTVRPGDEITRLQALKLATKMHRVLMVEAPVRYGAVQAFLDVPSNSPFAGIAMEAKDNGIVLGYVDGTLKPGIRVTSGQADAMLDRVGQKLEVRAIDGQPMLTVKPLGNNYTITVPKLSEAEKAELKARFEQTWGGAAVGPRPCEGFPESIKVSSGKGPFQLCDVPGPNGLVFEVRNLGALPMMVEAPKMEVHQHAVGAGLIGTSIARLRELGAKIGDDQYALPAGASMQLRALGTGDHVITLVADATTFGVDWSLMTLEYLVTAGTVKVGKLNPSIGTYGQPIMNLKKMELGVDGYELLAECVGSAEWDDAKVAGCMEPVMALMDASSAAGIPFKSLRPVDPYMGYASTALGVVNDYNKIKGYFDQMGAGHMSGWFRLNILPGKSVPLVPADTPPAAWLSPNAPDVIAIFEPAEPDVVAVLPPAKPTVVATLPAPKPADGSTSMRLDTSQLRNYSCSPTCGIPGRNSPQLSAARNGNLAIHGRTYKATCFTTGQRLQDSNGKGDTVWIKLSGIGLVNRVWLRGTTPAVKCGTSTYNPQPAAPSTTVQKTSSPQPKTSNPQPTAPNTVQTTVSPTASVSGLGPYGVGGCLKLYVGKPCMHVNNYRGKILRVGGGDITAYLVDPKTGLLRHIQDGGCWNAKGGWGNAIDNVGTRLHALHSLRRGPNAC